MQIIIYGAGNYGKSAYYILRGKYEILFMVDKDSFKWGNFEKVKIQSPSVLKDYKDIALVIASQYYKEILEEIKVYGMKKIYIYKTELEYKDSQLIKELDSRTIDLGKFLIKNQTLECKELTFMTGGSRILDYFFIKSIAEQFHCKKYVEIGTYIGESINILTDCCDELYSITAPLNSEYSMRTFCKENNVPDYSERLTYNSKIRHFYTDSKEFDFGLLPEDIDLFFIDGDHSYGGVFSDTSNVFHVKKPNAIVIWHDMKASATVYSADIVNAVKDAIKDKFDNVYVTNNNICGIYLPEQYKKYFSLKKLQYEEQSELYVYDTMIRVSKRL